MSVSAERFALDLSDDGCVLVPAAGRPVLTCARILLVNRDGRIDFANKALLGMLHITDPASLVGTAQLPGVLKQVRSRAQRDTSANMSRLRMNCGPRLGWMTAVN